MARSFVMTRTFAGIEAAGIEASAARGIETARRAMPRLARLLGRGMAALALAVVACGGAPVAWGQEQADIPLRYTAPGKDPIYLYWKGKFLKKRRLGPINFELCSEGKDGNDLNCASTVMYTGKKDRNTLKSFDYCKDNTNQFALKAYRKDEYSGLEIPVIYFGEKALGNLSLHILKINKRFSSSLPLKASRIENGRRSGDSRNDLLLRPVVLHKEGCAPQPVIVVCDSTEGTEGYEDPCDPSEAERELVADYIKPGSSYWTAPPANDVHQTCKTVAGNGSLISQNNMGVSGSGAGAGAAGGATLLRVRFVDKNGKQKDTGYGYIHILPGACTDDTQAARGTEWLLNTMIPLPSDLHYKQKKRGKKDEAPICIVLKNLKKKKGRGAESACRDWTYVKDDTVLQVPADGRLKSCPRGTFNFKVLVDERPVPAKDLVALLRAHPKYGKALQKAKLDVVPSEDNILSVDGQKKPMVEKAMKRFFSFLSKVRCSGSPCVYSATQKLYVFLKNFRLGLVERGRAATQCEPIISLSKADGCSGQVCDKINMQTDLDNYNNGWYVTPDKQGTNIVILEQSTLTVDKAGVHCRLPSDQKQIQGKEIIQSEIQEGGLYIATRNLRPQRISLLSYHIVDSNSPEGVEGFHRKMALIAVEFSKRQRANDINKLNRARLFYWKGSEFAPSSSPADLRDALEDMHASTDFQADMDQVKKRLEDDMRAKSPAYAIVVMDYPIERVPDLLKKNSYNCPLDRLPSLGKRSAERDSKSAILAMFLLDRDNITSKNLKILKDMLKKDGYVKCKGDVSIAAYIMDPLAIAKRYNAYPVGSGAINMS